MSTTHNAFYHDRINVFQEIPVLAQQVFEFILLLIRDICGFYHIEGMQYAVILAVIAVAVHP